MKSTADCKNLLECALYWEATTPDRICATQPMGGGDTNIKTWTWSEMVGEARRVASHLKSLDLPAQSCIALCSKNCAYWIMADLAIGMAGHVSVPVYPVLTKDMVTYILEHSEARLLFVGKLDPVWAEMKKGVAKDLKVVAFPLAPENDYVQWNDIIARHAPLLEIANRRPEETAAIIYTSGSTGKPKGVVISFEAMYKGGKGLSTLFKINTGDRALSYLPLAHSMERLAAASGLFAGVEGFYMESLDTFLHDLKRAHSTIFASVPRLWLNFQLGVFEKVPPEKIDWMLKIPIISSIVKKKVLKQLGLDKVRIAFSGSASIPKEIIDWYRRLGLELLEGYGMTENFAYSHICRSGEIRPGYVGRPCPGVEQKIDQNGEILVKSPCNMKGYYKMPEKTAKAFTEDGFLRTGDLGEVDEMGRLKITGRIKELFKTSKGNYVAPAPIENRILNHYLVEGCYVTGEGFRQPYCVVMLSQAATQEASKGTRHSFENKLMELLKQINGQLAPFEQLAFLAVTKDVWSAENGFLTPTFKIKRKVLEQTYSPLAEKWYAMNKPIIWQTA